MIPSPLQGEPRASFGLRVAAELVSEARKINARETCIYFIQDEEGAIKVGVADDPYRRLAALQTANPDRLTLRAFYPGPASLERVIHRAFADDRLAGEWFVGSEALEAVADTLGEAAVSHRLVVSA